MNEMNVPMVRVYQLVGELYVNNSLMADHISKQNKDMEALTQKNGILEQQIKMLQGTPNGSSQEE